MALIGGFEGMETVLPDNLFLHDLFLGFLFGVQAKNFDVSIPFDFTNSLTTCPPLAPGTLCCFAITLQLIGVSVGQLLTVAQT